jgi:hypothetical protein
MSEVMQSRLIGMFLIAAGACEPHQAGQAPLTEASATTAQASTSVLAVAATPKPPRKLYLDVHELGPGKVDAQAVAGAHQRDLQVQGKHDVDFKAYWVDAKQGKIYCLAEAPSPDATSAVHREAHGLMASRIMEVTGDSATWRPSPGAKLYLDEHRFGPGKVSAAAVAEAHRKDLAAQGHGVTFLNYWFDEASGTVRCLVEAQNPEAAIEVHRQAHGLLPDTIEEVSEGR